MPSNTKAPLSIFAKDLWCFLTYFTVPVFNSNTLSGVIALVVGVIPQLPHLPTVGVAAAIATTIAGVVADERDRPSRVLVARRQADACRLIGDFLVECALRIDKLVRSRGR